MKTTSIRKQVIKLGMVTTFIVSTILYVTITLGIRDGFNELENNTVDDSVQRIANGLETNSKFLTAKSGDWARWDETYRFVDDHNQDYIDENMTEDALATLDINIMFFVNKQGEVVHQEAIDTTTFEFVEIEEETKNKLDEVAKLMNDQKLSILNGYINVKGKAPLLFVAQSIVKSDGSGPENGTIIFARYLDSEIIAQLEDITLYPLQMETLDPETEKSQLSDEFGKIFPILLKTQRPYTDVRKDDINGYSLFKDISDKPAFIFRVNVPREISHQSNTITNYVFIMVILSGLLFSVLGFFFIELTVLRRLSTLHKQLKYLSAEDKQKPKFTIEGNDEITYLATQISDMLTKLSRTKKYLQTSQERYKSIAEDLEKFKLAVQSASDHIQIMDTEGQIIYINKAGEQTTGYKMEEILGKKSEQMWAKNMDGNLHKKLWETVKEKKQLFVGETTNIRKKGEKYIAEIHIFPILNAHQKVIFYVQIERDITRIKEIDNMKSEFVTIASHQLRTPLSVINWLTEILIDEQKGHLTGEQKDLIRQIEQSNQRMVKLVNDLLEVTHIENDKNVALVKTPVDMTNLVEKSLSEQSATIKLKHLDVHFENKLPPKAVLIANSEKISHVVRNLLTNAVKYSRDKGKVIIELTKQDKEIQLKVQDFGIGIIESDQGRVYEKFFRSEMAVTTDPEGSGLGLYITKTIVEAHGGKIWFNSEENKGTTFYVTLPLEEK